ncbi:uncharacterized protein TEOVI_000762200 [Trypanosoma equiperdum]|uniref:Uncharacterized protein n=1 Tax=Trypanosoma equiperdum TaxID=5694 RepID=A0A1G4I850_TRYEQ|nr:hypothetical protein, conserved [Trypanosoma equiperdum]
MALHFGRHDALKMQQKAATKQVGQAQADNGNPVVKAITLKEGTLGLTSSKCHIEEYAKAAQTGPNKATWAKQQLTIKKVEAVAGADTNTPSAAQVCVGSTGATCTSNGAYIFIQGGKLYTTTAANPSRGAQKSSAQYLTIYIGSDEKAQQLAVLDTELIQATAPGMEIDSKCNQHEQLEDLELLEDAAAAADPEHKRPTANAKNKQNLQVTVKNLYGGKESEFNSKFWKTFDDLLVPTKKEAEIKKKKLSTINGPEQLRQSLELAAMMAIIENNTKKTATCTATVTTSETTACDKKLKKTDCKESDGCKWTNDKEETGNHCKPKNDKKEVDKISATECTATEEGKCDKKKCDWNKKKS